MRRLVWAAAAIGMFAVCTSVASARVLRVGTYKGIRGQFSSIQAAVDAAKPGDWILVGPGDYKEHSGRAPKGHADVPAGVLMTTRHVYLRGMNRNTVIVDGTKPGSAVCSRKTADQEFGPKGRGLNGVEVFAANDVWVQNLTACNYLAGNGETGNEIWWNGRVVDGQVGGKGFLGSYLTTTSTFFKDEKTAAQYGIFSSNWNGGTWDQTYASNFNDSGYYIGACQQVCNQVVNHAHGQFNALGYSGSNSGGSLVVKNSEFDHNQDGFDTNSQNGDNPAPQDGACPGNKVSPITHTHSCWVFMNNFVHDNNNPNVPGAGAAASGPVGTGMSVSGGRNDTIMNNRFVNNNAWGIILVPYTDNRGTDPCVGGTTDSPLTGKGTCLWDDFGDAILNNKFTNNGGFGNPTNGDFSQLNFESNPSDCYRGNTNTAGSLKGEAANLQQKTPTCSTTNVSANLDTTFLSEVLCDSQIQLPPFGCQPGDHYPRRTKVVMHPLPKGLKTMPNPCAGVPSNPWCPGRKRARTPY
jgi:parallel beta-helix repeat protein